MVGARFALEHSPYKKGADMAPVDEETRVLQAIGAAMSDIKAHIGAGLRQVEHNVLGRINDLEITVARIDGRTNSLEGRVVRLESKADECERDEIATLRAELSQRETATKKWVFWAVTTAVSLLFGGSLIAKLVSQ